MLVLYGAYNVKAAAHEAFRELDQSKVSHTKSGGPLRQFLLVVD